MEESNSHVTANEKILLHGTQQTACRSVGHHVEPLATKLSELESQTID
jgi:hypothetical protein